MTIDVLVQLIAEKKYDEWLDALEKEAPRAINQCLDEAAKKGLDIGDFTEQICDNDERYKRLRWLGSTQREREYFMSIPDEEMTHQDWLDFRACDF